MRRFVLTALALAVVSGCSLVEGDAEVSFVVDLPSDAAADLAARASVDGRDVPLTVQPTTGRALASGPRSVSARPGRVACTVARGAASTRVEARLPFESGLRYPVRCEVRPESQPPLCMGCTETVSAALDPALGLDGHALFLSWAAVDPDHPVLYGPTSG